MNGESSYPSKRQRKNGSSSLPASNGVSALTENAHLCQNSACRATIHSGDKFCKCCSCCICFKYDDNKDPTLWIFCNSDHQLQEESCGFSCHLECAIEDERSGIQQSGQTKKLDGDYCCTQCGKQNGLLRCLEKQLLVAKDARSLDVLCHRIFLSYKILISTKKYMVLHDIVDTAIKKLEAEVGPITGSCMTHCRVPPSNSQISNVGDVGESKVCGVEKFPGVSAATFDEEQEIPRSNAQIATPAHSGNMLVDPPEDHVPQDWYLNAETDLESSSRLDNSSDAHNENELACEKTGNEIKSGNGISATRSKLKICNHIPETGSSYAQRETIARNKLAPGQDMGTSVSPSFAGTADTITEVSSPEVALMGDPSHTRMINTHESERRELCNHIIKGCGRLEMLAYEMGKREAEAYLKAEVVRLTEELETAGREKANALMKTKSIEEALRTESEWSQRIEMKDLEKEVDELNKKNELMNQMIDQVTKSSEEENKDQVEQLNKEIEHASQTWKSSEGEKAALEDQVNKMNQRIEEASRALELEKTIVEKANQEKKALEDQVKQLNQRIEGASRAPELEKTVPESSSNKSLSGKPEEVNREDGQSESSYEYCVKVLRRLGCEGYIEASFRVKFLTWFCLRAMPHERRVVSVYVDTLIDDPHQEAPHALGDVEVLEPGQGVGGDVDAGCKRALGNVQVLKRRQQQAGEEEAAMAQHRRPL
ncbi:hypothetical protein HU200_043142 [Digitaria exilis]|uniref:Oberon PHD finger domain-containing protein n=1 Tax=Digitaria exilis TaxID=1010633 RepID=A0A835BA83_9POAL|nr:hypothetical protein HU200_043142 [Digitaria exilis]